MHLVHPPQLLLHFWKIELGTENMLVVNCGLTLCLAIEGESLDATGRPLYPRYLVCHGTVDA